MVKDPTFSKFSSLTCGLWLRVVDSLPEDEVVLLLAISEADRGRDTDEVGALLSGEAGSAALSSARGLLILTVLERGLGLGGSFSGKQSEFDKI